MKKEKQLIAQLFVEELAEKLEEDAEELFPEIKEVVDESIDVDRTYPITLTVTSESGSYSQKPTNIELEYDLATAFTLIGQVLGAASGNPEAQGSAIAMTCALVSNKSKVAITDQAGFVYWVAYNNHDVWEIPKSQLVVTSIEESEKVDANISLSEESVEEAIEELARKDCIDIEHRDEDLVILRELCIGKWE